MEKTVIFDLDGTLLNTISDLGHACNHALRELGLPEHPITAYNRMVGNGLRKLIERAAPGEQSETIDRLIVECKAYYNEHCTETTVPYPGIPELLEELVKRNYRIAVASNKYQEGVDRIISHYFPGIPFVAVQGQQEGRPIKPDPAIIDDIMGGEEIKKETVVMIGDSTVDIETARRAGATSIAVDWGFSPLTDLLPAGADHYVSSGREILDILGV